jgi:hypothetical protein
MTSIQSNKTGLYVYLTELALFMIVGLISYRLLVRQEKDDSSLEFRVI